MKFSGYSMANPCPSLAESGSSRSLSNGGGKYKFGHLMRVETYPNGGGKVLHMWQDEINSLRLGEADLERVSEEFLHVREIVLNIFFFSNIFFWILRCS